MKISSAIILVLLLCSFCVAENPGIVAVVKKQIIDQIRDQYFAAVFKAIGHQTIPNVDAGDLKISDIVVDLSNPAPANLVTSFSKTINAIGVALK